MKKVLGGLAILLILGLALAGCSNAVVPGGDPEVRAAVTPTADDIEKAVYAGDPVINTTRTNASGDKITSNAHSADFPGIFFFWDSKQKDDGILKVDAKYFTKFDEFVLTVKDANLYVDFTVSIQVGQEKTADGYFTFKIPRGFFNDKNINMVFLNDWVKSWNFIMEGDSDPDPVESKSIVFYKKVVSDTGKAIIVTDWLAQPYCDWTFDILDGDDEIALGLKLDADGKIAYTGEEIQDGVEYTIRENLNGWESKYLAGGLTTESTEMLNYTILSGKAATEGFVLDNVFYQVGTGAELFATSKWNEGLYAATPDLYNKLMSIEKDGDKAQWIWDGTYKDTLAAFGISGSEVTIDTEKFTIPAGYNIPSSVPFYYACDNAAVVYVNGTWVGNTTKAFGGTTGEGQFPFFFKTLDKNTFNGSLWDEVYVAEIAGALKHGENTITIYAANSWQTTGTGEESDGWNDTNNPCGLIFACSFDVEKTDKSITNTKITYYGANDDEITPSNNNKALFVSIRVGRDGGDATVGDILISSWETCLRLAHFSAGNPQEYDIMGNMGTKVGIAVLEIVNGNLVATVKLTDGSTIGQDKQALRVGFSSSELNAGQGTWGAIYEGGPLVKDQTEFTFTIPHAKLIDYIVD